MKPTLYTWLLVVSSESLKTIPPPGPWAASVKEKQFNQCSYKFVSEASTVEEAFEALYAAGFCCVLCSQGQILSAGNMKVSVSRLAE